MIPAILVFIYLAIVLYIGILPSGTRREKKSGGLFSGESLAWSFVFLFSLFGTKHDRLRDPGFIWSCVPK